MSRSPPLLTLARTLPAIIWRPSSDSMPNRRDKSDLWRDMTALSGKEMGCGFQHSLSQRQREPFVTPHRKRRAILRFLAIESSFDDAPCGGVGTRAEPKTGQVPPDGVAVFGGATRIGCMQRGQGAGK